MGSKIRVSTVLADIARETKTSSGRVVSLSVIAALVATTALQTGAIAYPGPAGGKTDACATPRAPLTQRDKEYEEMKRSKVAGAIGEGLKAGVGMLASGMLGRGGGGLGGGLGGALGGLGGAFGGKKPAAAAPGAPLAFGLGAFDPNVLSQLGGLRVPGISNNSGLSGDGKTFAALSVVVAIAGAIGAYLGVKQKENAGDPGRMSYAIEADATRQLPVSRSTATELFGLADCRQKQVDDINLRFAAASNDSDRKSLRKERNGLEKTLKADVDMAGDINGQESGMAKVFTQGRASVENTSEASVLGAQTPAYAASAATTKMSLSAAGMPGAEQAGGGASATRSAESAALVTNKATIVRTEPSAKGGVLMNFPKGREVKPIGRAAGNPTWWEVDLGGTPGYVSAADLVEGKGGGKASAAKPAAAGAKFATPTNIREYNKTVLAARTGGQARLSSLSADIKTGFRIERKPSLQMAARWYLGRTRKG